ncbi:MAG: hypothetical protein J0653_04695, partial [Deltaproteobacteria bacterium]|nr:hypothetical protein [Deltaproteobacteria bacterium]
NNYLGIRIKKARSLKPGDFFNLIQAIEDKRISGARFGQVEAKPLTLSFWIRTSLNGTHSGALSNATSTRSFPFSFTVDSADTWEYKTICIPGDTTGDWPVAGNRKGMFLIFNLATCQPYIACAGQWACSKGSISIVETQDASFFITGIQLEEDSSATPFVHIPFKEELVRCQRYFETLGDSSKSPELGNGFSSGNNTILAHIPFRTQKRCAPTILLEGNDFAFITKSGSFAVTPLTVIGTGITALFISGKIAGIQAGQDGVLQTRGTSRITLSSEL